LGRERPASTARASAVPVTLPYSKLMANVSHMARDFWS